MSTVSITEQSITEALRRVPPDRWPQVLAFIDSLQLGSGSSFPDNTAGSWSATELRKLAPALRDAILEKQAAYLENDYRHDSELTAFDAFGDEDLYVDSSDPEAR